MDSRSALLAVPYNPLSVPGGLQHRALRTAKALEDAGWRAAVAAPGSSGICRGTRVIGFRTLGDLACLISREDWRIIHWLDVFPSRRTSVAQHILSLAARAIARRYSLLGTGTPGNLTDRGAPALLRPLARHAYDAAVVFGPAFAPEYLQAGFDARRILRLRQHVDCRYFAPCSSQARETARSQLGLGAHEFVVAYVGRLVRRKRVDVLIDAFRRLATCSSGWALLIAGDSARHEDSVDGEIMRSIRQLDQNGLRVRYHPYADDPRTYYRAADVVVVPSDRDGETAVALEAAASGRLTFVSDAPGLAEIFPDDAQRVMFRRGSPHELAALLNTVRRSNGDHEALATRQRRRVLEHHDVADLAPRLIAIYAALTRWRESNGC